MILGALGGVTVNAGQSASTAPGLCSCSMVSRSGGRLCQAEAQADEVTALVADDLESRSPMNAPSSLLSVRIPASEAAYFLPLPRLAFMPSIYPPLARPRKPVMVLLAFFIP